MAKPKIWHHHLLGEVDQDGPTVYRDTAAEPPAETTPDEPEEHGFSFPAPDPSPPTPRERIEERLQEARRQTRGVAARALRMLADHIEK